MSLLASLPRIVEACRQEYERALREDVPATFHVSDRMGSPGENRLILGDNLDWLHRLVKSGEGLHKVSLIYVDPPFYSGSNYRAEVRISTEKQKIKGMKSNAYQDRWGGGMEGFLSMLTLRLMYMKELLTEDGGIIVHLDWRAVHYVKVIMDELFGQKRFVNEIIWNYKSGGVSTRSFAKKHDTLLYYAGGNRHYFHAKKEKSYNRAFKPYRFKGVKEYKDELGWYTMVNRKDVLDVDMVGRTSHERTGYATQKPERLLEILLESCTKPGDLCADFFAGSGTLAAAACRMGRSFMVCDSSPLAIAASRKRLTSMDAPYVYYISEKEKNGTSATIKAEVETRETISRQALCRVRLTKYERSCRNLPVSDVEKAALEKLQAADPLALVDYWCIDRNYDGVNFQTQQWFAREKADLRTEAEFLTGPARRAAIKVYDVFGGFGIMEIQV